MHKTPVILQVLPALKTGGVERGTIEIAKALTKNGWKAIVASSGGPLTPSLSYVGANHITVPLDGKGPLRIWRNISAIENIIRTHKVDIVHARSRAPAWSAYFAAKRCGVHFVTTFHGVYGLKNKWKQKYNAIMTKGERVIAVSHFIARHIKANYTVDAERIRVIHRGIDPKIFSPLAIHPQRMAELSRTWHVPEDLPVILFPGRITRWKGQHVFIEALAKLPHRNFIALLVGDDHGHEQYREELEQLIAQHKLEGHVRMVGATASMPEAYTLARVVVATSLEPEAFGRVVLEAQAMGRPVIATNHGGARETVAHAETGWLIEPNNTDALASQIDDVLQMSDEQIYDIGERAVQNARRFSSEDMCERTLAVYNELL